MRLKSLFTKDKKVGNAQMPLDVILQRDYSINSLCCLSIFFFLASLWSLRGVRQIDKPVHYPFILFALFRNRHRSRHDVWSLSFFLLYLGDTLRGQMSWNSWTLLCLHTHKKKEHKRIEIIVFVSVFFPRPKNKCTEILEDLITGYTKESWTYNRFF